MLKLDLTKQSLKFLSSLPPKQFRQVVNKIFGLMADPVPGDSIRMEGYPYRRADIGEYRIVYRVENDCLKVAVIGKRNDSEVYEQLKRKQ
jgi:mRNA interferase RelE/StbE